MTADIQGANVRLLANPASADVKIKFYRIMVSVSATDASAADSKTVGNVTVSSSATAIDSFVDSDYTGAHYI